MRSNIFEHVPGRLVARFRHGAIDDEIVLRLAMSGAGVRTTPCDHAGDFGATVAHKQRDALCSVCLSAISCPCAAFVHFLEGVCVGVQECAFNWDAEGRCGRMELAVPAGR